MSIIKTFKGIVHGGRIDVPKTIKAPDGTQVEVNVPVELDPGEGMMMKYGMFTGSSHRMSREEDFQEARASIWGKNP